MKSIYEQFEKATLVEYLLNKVKRVNNGGSFESVFETELRVLSERENSRQGGQEPARYSEGVPKIRCKRKANT